MDMDKQKEVLPHHLTEGTILAGRYSVGKAFGEGGFGITYMGTDTKLDMTVAIKEYYPTGFVNRNNTHSENITANTGDSEAFFNKGKDNFLNEARILAKFANEQGIVGVRDFFNENNTAYIVMDYLNGITLRDRLEQSGKMPADQVLQLMMPVMSSLSRIHEQGLIHRDISPDNIMMLAEGSLKLLDFGAAREISGLDEKSLSVMLKPGYAPEEQYRSKGIQGPWTDIYALCATIYKCITGITPVDAMQRIFHDEVKPPSALGVTISPQHESALMKGMAISQKDRYQSIYDLWNAFFALPEPVPVTPPQVTPAQVTPAAVTPIADNPVNVDPVTPNAAIPGTPPGTPPGFPVKPKPKKKKTMQKILAGICIGVGSIILPVIIFNFLGSLSDVNIDGVVYESGTTSVSFYRDPGYEELKKLENLPNLQYLYLYYSVGLTDETLKIINNLTGLESLSLGAFGDNEPPFTADLSLISDLDNLSSLYIKSAIGLDLSQIKNSEGIRILNINNSPLNDLSALSNFTSLSTLTINYSLEDISTLPEIPTLRYLYLEKNMISDASSLKNVTNITYLDVRYNQLSNFKGLENSENLRTIFAGNNNLTDISALENIDGLNQIDIRDNELETLSGLENHEHLRFLQANNNALTDISALNDLTLLKEVNFNNNKISDLSPMSNKRELTEFFADNNNITNLDSFEHALHLQFISVANNNITSIAGLTNSTQLKLVNFNNNNITDISVLSKSTDKLIDLFLVNNNITNLSPLSSLSNLLTIALDGNGIEDISALSGLVKLENIFLHNNKIKDISALTNITNIFYLDLSGNMIEDIRPLSGIDPEHRMNRFLTIDISSNNISDISSFPKNVEILAAVYIYNNPITDISSLSGKKMSVLAFTYDEDLDIAPLFEIERHLGVLRFYSVDTPLDKQVNLTNRMREDTQYVMLIPTIHFVSLQEITDYKNEQRNKITGLDTDDGQEDNETGPDENIESGDEPDENNELSDDPNDEENDETDTENDDG